MVETASFGRKRIQIHNFSTLPCGFGRKKLLRTNFCRKRFDPSFLNSQFENVRFIAIIRMELQFYGSFLHWKAFMIYCQEHRAFDIGGRIQLLAAIGI